MHPVSVANDYDLEYENGKFYIILKGITSILIRGYKVWVWLIFEKAYKESLNMMQSLSIKKALI